MLDNEFRISKKSKAILVSLVAANVPEHSTEKESLQSLRELRELMRTLGIEVGSHHYQNRKAIDSATMIGKGKLEEIKEIAEKENVNLLVFDLELSSSQIRNIKEITGLDVVDRCHVILEIFAEHARTKEAKIQIEIARLQYLLPRLTGFWSHFSRQRGGVGVLGGEGEQQIELDRRMIRKRIEFYKSELDDVKKTREQQRKNRSNQAIIAALVGYTNAGKSSLMNRLCKVNVLEENKLFATLDSTFRMLSPNTKPPMLLVDTVGFIANLPNTLIDGFKTTLESALEADLLIIVCDISDPNYKKHLEVTESVLKELGLEEKERLIVFNKRDLLDSIMTEKIIRRGYAGSFVVSSFNEEDVKELREHIIEYFLSKQATYELFIPYADGESHSKVASKMNVLVTENYEKGIFYKVKIPSHMFEPLALKQYILGPHSVRDFLR